MKHTRESIGNYYLGQLRHHRSTVSLRGAQLYNALTNITNFGLPKSVGIVPDENIGKDSEGLWIR